MCSSSTCCQNYRGQSCIVPCVVTAVTVFALGVITLFVMGILGAVGSLAIPPMGVQIMLGLSTFFILSALSFLCKTCGKC